MAQAMVNFRMDEELKHRMEKACKEMGMSMTAAFTIFATKVSNERRIPFEIAADPDPFYAEANIRRLRKAIADVESGKAKLSEHELIEANDEKALA
jgi:DNA-damage-inducible protein J